MKNFSKIVLQWYAHHKRELPWREEKDPYKIWVSEIILQQTRIAQGWNYYLRFMERFPTITSLAEAPEDEVLKQWQGLGYYTRARNMHTGAKYIMQQHKGIFPKQYEAILKIKGVGEYTAAAIASMAFGLPYAAIDGNVFRVLTRVFGIDTPVDTLSGKKEIKDLADCLIDKKQAGLFNQAMMDFGSLQCISPLPDCDPCCFAFGCIAKQKEIQTLLPVKLQKTKIRTRYFQYFHIRKQEKTYIHKRRGNDIWKGLYEFPLVESEKELSIDEILSHPFLTHFLTTCKWTVQRVSALYKHQLSHQLLIAQFITIAITEGNPLVDNTFIAIKEQEINAYPVARLTELFLETKE